MMSYFRDLKQEFDESLQHADPRTRDWFLLWQNPVYVWVLTAAYLIFVWLGPKFMKNREPFDLKWPMVIYNLALVGLSAYMFIEIIISHRLCNYGLMCAVYTDETRKNPNELRMASVLWWYFFSKAIELMDTVLMVLRKKDKQITFLHVFHHATMLNIWWWVTMWIPGGLAYFGSCLNCLVHVVMYSYYGLSVLPSLRGKLWFKHYITQFQLIQFCITLTHSTWSIFSGCDFPRWGKNLLAGYMVVMLILFTNFYIHAYLTRGKDKGKSNGRQNGSTIHQENGSASINGHGARDSTRKRVEKRV